MPYAIKAEIRDPKRRLSSSPRGRPCMAASGSPQARRPLGRRELRSFTDRKDGGPQSELNFKLYRQATNKIAGISEDAAAFLMECF